MSGKGTICRHEKVAQDGICDVISRIADQIVIMRSLNVHQNIGNYIKGVTRDMVDGGE